MRSPAAQILETALALQRAPGERFRLRERPLPAGLAPVLEVASGSSQALAAAAAELGEAEADLLEAARFYLEQVLFAAPDATAYRILGVPQDAPAELIRTHHRWLQRWLHPDRAQAGDASVYATRVNEAWATLRSPDSRHQYDVRLAEARLAGASAPLPVATVRHWEHDDATPSHGRRSRWLLGAALVACAVLAVLIFRHEQGPEPWSPADIDLAAVQQEAPIDQPAIEDRDLGILTEALAIATAPRLEQGAAGAAPTVEVVPPPGAPHHVGAAQAAPPQPRTIPVATPAAPSPASPALIPTPKPIATARITTHPQRPHLVGAAEAAIEPPVPVQVAVSAGPTPEVVPQPTPQPPAVLVDRMQKAEQRVAQLAAFLAAQPGAAPLWNDLQTAQNAERIRQRIAASNGTALELTSPNWQLQRDNATLSVDYRCAQCRVRQGRIDVQLVWREGLWLVRGVVLAPAV